MTLPEATRILDKRVRARLCLYPGCERSTRDPGHKPWTMCRRHHSAGGSVQNYWRNRP